MKHALCLIILGFAGCRTVEQKTSLPTPEPMVVPSESIPDGKASNREADAREEIQSRRQMQWIEALINQNEALTARLAAQDESDPKPVKRPEEVKPVGTSVSGIDKNGPTMTPNAEGIIDLTTLVERRGADEVINPFAVRMASNEATREISVTVGGIIRGTVPCAVVNGRLVQEGQVVEALTVERIMPDAVIVRFGASRLRLPVSNEPVRVKLPL